MSAETPSRNHFLTAPVGRVFAATALPMVAIMLMNGLLGVVDAAFLGHFVGPEAMAAVGIAFPVMMLIVALSTLVSGGMSSMLARQLGAGDRAAAGATFARAHGLAMLIAGVLIALFVAFGHGFATAAAGGDALVARMTWTFLIITILGTPIQFFLALEADTWRNEGRAGMMALMSVGVTLMNIALNYLLIVHAGLGVAGSAIASVLAQAVGLALLGGMRVRGSQALPLSVLWHNRWTGGWLRNAALGAPLSLSFIGMALTSGCVVAALRLTGGEALPQLLAAYGIATRIFTFAFLPIMALALAMQSVVGNNVGAGMFHRSDMGLRIAATTAFIYGLIVQALMMGAGAPIAAIFVDDPAVIAQSAHILRIMAGAWALSGPVLMLGLYFQAIGKPALAAIPTMVKPFILLPGLIVALAAFWGAEAIWFAYPFADVIAAAVAVLMLTGALKQRGPQGGIGIGGVA